MNTLEDLRLQVRNLLIEMEHTDEGYETDSGTCEEWIYDRYADRILAIFAQPAPAPVDVDDSVIVAVAAYMDDRATARDEQVLAAWLDSQPAADEGSGE